MTSLDMAGFSVSVMKVDQAILQRLDAVTKASCRAVGLDAGELCLSALNPGEFPKNDKFPG